jgi:hypothetical protein
VREHEEKLRLWHQQYNTSYQTPSTSTQKPREYSETFRTLTPITSTQKSYVRVTYTSSTVTPQSFASQNTTKPYRLNGASYRRNITQSTTMAPLLTTATRKPKTSRLPKTTSTSTTTTEIPSTTTEMPTTPETTQSAGHRRPMHFGKVLIYSESILYKCYLQYTLTTATSELTTSEPIKRGESVEALEGFDGILVNRWVLPVNESENAGLFLNNNFLVCSTRNLSRYVFCAFC